MVSLTLKGVRNSHDHKMAKNRLLMIQLIGSFNERVGGTLGDKICYRPVEDHSAGFESLGLG